jgi:hypothetical protein
VPETVRSNVRSRSGRSKGSGLSTTWSTSENRAVDALMASVSTVSTTAVKPGAARSPRSADCRSRASVPRTGTLFSASTSSSFTRGLPNLRRASRCAASRRHPRACSSSAYSSICARISSARSRSVTRRPKRYQDMLPPVDRSLTV